MGDMNAKSTMWGEQSKNAKGKIFEELVVEEDLVILNSGTATHYHVQTNSYSVVDLTIRSADCQLQFAYEVLDSLYDSDHYPIKIEFTVNNTITTKVNKFNIKKANWVKYKELTEINIQQLPNANNTTEILTKHIIAAAEQSIPRVNTNLKRPPMPWWDEDCDNARRERLRAERAVKQNPNEYNKIRYSRAKAICRRTFNNAHRESLNKYTSKINSKTQRQMYSTSSSNSI